MKIQVIRCDGKTETITLTDPVSISRGEGMNCLKTSTGFEHFFTQDGIYDGWGMSFAGSFEEAESVIEEVEKGREFGNDPESLANPN